MPPKEISTGSHHPPKRKEHPTSSAASKRPNNHRREPKRVKILDARSILAQTSDAALSNGDLDLQKFLAAREFEIKALDNGMQRAKGALTTRAFQQVPRDMRRRTASHNVKRVPKRLQRRAKREMREDNTPTVTPNKRKPSSSRGRVRAETARRLGVLAERKKRAMEGERTVKAKAEKARLVGRAPRAKKGMLSAAPVPKSKFRKRQIHKTWLPTHMYHAKRAKMTDPKQPLWRFAVPLTSTEKSYRPTHRSGGKRGAVCWDMSYMATIGLEGSELALEKVLRGVGIGQEEMWGDRGQKWREGKRSWSGYLSRAAEGGRIQISPGTIVWSALGKSLPIGPSEKVQESSDGIGATVVDESDKKDSQAKTTKKLLSRRLIIRVHPAAFLELWDELLRIAKMQRPVVHVEDLRYEIGSIEVTGPGSTEALLGILQPFTETDESELEPHAKIFKTLGGVTNPASLPPNALLTFSVTDPRLRFPPRTAELPKVEDEQAAFSLLEMLADWPPDETSGPSSFFNRSTRQKATQLPSQKALNRRKGLAPPGEFPTRAPSDPSIPILLYTTRPALKSAAQGTWHLLGPWKCIVPIWYGLMHYPLSSGGNPRFGGLQEMQQTHFEQGRAWFPGDYPGTHAGWAWELDERQRRKADWDGRPRGKRTEFSSLNLGAGKKGEIGLGWACDFERLLDEQPSSHGSERPVEDEKALPLPGQPLPPKVDIKFSPIPPPFQHLQSSEFSALLANPERDVPLRSLAIVRISLFSRGVPLSCARIYRLPSSSDLLQPAQTSQTQNTSISTTKIIPNLREKWLALIPAPQKVKRAAKFKSTIASSSNTQGIPATLLSRRTLAQELLQEPPLPYPALPPENADLHPAIPGEEDLIGFVTTGNFNLAEGKGIAIGSVVVAKVVESFVDRNRKVKTKGRERRMCIVRNAGETVGRLGIWEVM